MNNPNNQNQWMPFENVFQQIGNHTKFEVMMMDDSIHTAQYDDNDTRCALMVQDSTGMFWRCMALRPASTPTKWRKIQ